MSKTHSFSKRSFGVFWFSTEKLDENIKYAKMMSADVLCDHFIVVLYEVLGQKSIDWQLSECFCTRVQTKTPKVFYISFTASHLIFRHTTPPLQRPVSGWAFLCEKQKQYTRA